jgi:hypothetical protein
MLQLTWADLTTRQPALTKLEDKAKELHRDSVANGIWAADAIWHGYAKPPYGPHHGFKNQLRRYVGWDAPIKDSVVNSQQAYNLAYDHLYEVLCWVTASANPRLVSCLKSLTVQPSHSMRKEKAPKPMPAPRVRMAKAPKPAPLPRQPHRHAYLPTTSGVYIIASPDSIYKIGMAKNIQQRVRGIDTHVPFVLVVKAIIETGDPASLEKQLHRAYHDKRVKGEWFRLDDDDIEAIRGQWGKTC